MSILPSIDPETFKKNFRKRWSKLVSLPVDNNVQETAGPGVPLSLSVDHKDSVTNFEDCTPVLHHELPNFKQNFAEREVNDYFSHIIETVSFDQDLRMVLKEIVKAEVNDYFSRLNNNSAMASNDDFPVEEDFPDVSGQIMADGRPLSRDEFCRLVQDKVRIKVNEYFVKMIETATFGQNFRMLLKEMVKAEVKIRNEFQGKSEDLSPVGNSPAISSGGDVSVPAAVTRLELSRIVEAMVRIEVNGYFSKVKKTASSGQEFRMVLKEIVETEVKDNCCKRLQNSPANSQSIKNTNIPMSSPQPFEEDQYISNYPIGFHFKPKQCELITDYLEPKIKYGCVPNNLISQINLMDFGPDDISGSLGPILQNEAHEKMRYFFTKRARKYGNGSRPNRKSGEGYWKATGRDKNIHEDDDEDNGAIIGYMKTLTYCEGQPPNGQKTNWIMHEYRIDKNEEPVAKVPKKRALGDNEKPNMDLDVVLCHIYYRTKSEGGGAPDGKEENIKSINQQVAYENSSLRERKGKRPMNSEENPNSDDNQSFPIHDLYQIDPFDPNFVYFSNANNFGRDYLSYNHQTFNPTDKFQPCPSYSNADSFRGSDLSYNHQTFNPTDKFQPCPSYSNADTFHGSDLSYNHQTFNPTDKFQSCPSYSNADSFRGSDLSYNHQTFNPTDKFQPCPSYSNADSFRGSDLSYNHQTFNPIDKFQPCPSYSNADSFRGNDLSYNHQTFNPTDKFQPGPSYSNADSFCGNDLSYNHQTINSTHHPFQPGPSNSNANNIPDICDPNFRSFALSIWAPDNQVGPGNTQQGQDHQNGFDFMPKGGSDWDYEILNILHDR